MPPRPGSVSSAHLQHEGRDAQLGAALQLRSDARRARRSLQCRDQGTYRGRAAGGLIPFSAKDAKIGYSLISARPEGYETVALPVVNEQLEKAGVRLAAVLNLALR